MKRSDEDKKKRESLMSKDYKAGYTANTSCGRVGRGGNARFCTFQLDHHRPMDQQNNGPLNGQSL